MAMIKFSIFVFLLCLSLHACNARRSLGVMNKDLEERFLSSNKNNEKDTLVPNSVPPKSKPSSTENASVIEETRVNEDNEKLTISSEPIGKEVIKGDRVAQKQSLSSVVWTVPDKKKSEQQPGFNLDYAPPKTHPPVHN